MGQGSLGVPWQLVGFVLGAVGWIGTAAATGLLQWRVWRVRPAEVSSGMAWVGNWRACYHGDGPRTPLLRVMFCQAMGAGEVFVPREVSAAHGLMVAAVFTEALGKAAAACGLWSVHVGGGRDDGWARLALGAGGCFYLLASVCTAIAAGWNLSAMTSNQTIAFPVRFHLPRSPQAQEVGAAIYVAIFSSGLLFLATLLLLSYKNPLLPFNARDHPSSLGLSVGSSLVSWATDQSDNGLQAESFSDYSLSSCGVDNQVFVSEDY